MLCIKKNTSFYFRRHPSSPCYPCHLYSWRKFPFSSTPRIPTHHLFCHDEPCSVSLWELCVSSFDAFALTWVTRTKLLVSKGMPSSTTWGARQDSEPKTPDDDTGSPPSARLQHVKAQSQSKPRRVAVKWGSFALGRHHTARVTG